MGYRSWKTGRAVFGYGDLDFCWVRHGQDRFEKVPLKPSEGAVVSALFEDSQGRVWIGTRQGAVMYDGSGFQQLGPGIGLAALGKSPVSARTLRVVSGWRDRKACFTGKRTSLRQSATPTVNRCEESFASKPMRTERCGWGRVPRA